MFSWNINSLPRSDNTESETLNWQMQDFCSDKVSLNLSCLEKISVLLLIMQRRAANEGKFAEVILLLRCTH